MRISIITPSYQQGAYIQANIESVLNQDYSDFEHIIIDGGSTDETTSILKKYPHLKWVSERDEGQSDALNKGLKIATGDIIGWINSDDYYQPGAFQKIARVFKDSSTQWGLGNISKLDESTGVFSELRTELPTWNTLTRNPDIVRQQGAFFRREILVEAGGWNKDLHMTMDLDLWFRLLKIAPPCLINEQLAVFRLQPQQKSGLSNLKLQTKEIKTLLIRESTPKSRIQKLVLKKNIFYLKGCIKEIINVFKKFK